MPLKQDILYFDEKSRKSFHLIPKHFYSDSNISLHKRIREKVKVLVPLKTADIWRTPFSALKALHAFYDAVFCNTFHSGFSCRFF